MEHYCVEVDDETTLLRDAVEVTNAGGEEVNLSTNPADFGKDRVLRPRPVRALNVTTPTPGQENSALALSEGFTRSEQGPVICLLEAAICDGTFWNVAVVASATTRRYHLGIEVILPKSYDEAMASPQSAEWLRAIEEQVQQ
jgi:hypothetical protein